MSSHSFDSFPSDLGAGTLLQGFHQLERRQIRDILLVSSLFDFYLFEEEGLLYEQIQSEYRGLQLSHAPELTRVSSGSEALRMIRNGERFDLIITTLHIEDMTPLRLARVLRSGGVTTPVVLLAYDNRELNDLLGEPQAASAFHRIFLWQGDFRLLIAIVKSLEDELNVADDTTRFGVQCILLVEDDVRYASYFLPLLYSEVISHSQRLISEGLNAAHRALRMRARPKILLSTTWEEAEAQFERHQQHITGVISDVAFPRGGTVDPRAGLDFALQVKDRFFDVPVLLQSADPAVEQEAWSSGSLFLLKTSPGLVDDFRRMLRDYFSFGDFIFRRPDGSEAGRATDLKSLEEQLERVPDESLLYHASRNDFSNWFKARTEFRLASRLRPRKVSDYASTAEMRADILRQLREHRSFRQRGLFAEFSRDTFDPATSFARTGGGSVGGKARGLAFYNSLLPAAGVRNRFENLEIDVPPSLVIGTDVFDRFLEENGLRAFALSGVPDEEIARRFLAADHFPRETASDLLDFLTLCREPLAVRSSSLLEDAQFHPFAGVYQTYMIPNAAADLATRLRELVTAIKRVYASTFFRSAREYIRITSLRVEDEKMAVIVQQMVGARHGGRFYPEISGVARSWNFYPVGPQKPEEGIVSVALGLGRTIVEGGVAVRFSPRYPDHLTQFFSPRDAQRNHQRTFYALDMGAGSRAEGRGPRAEGDRIAGSAPSDLRPSALSPRPSLIPDERIVRHDLSAAEEDGTLQSLASTYSPENDALYDGISRAGMRIVTFAPVLRHRLIPLAEAIEFLTSLATWGMGAPVEIEFAVNLSVPRGARKQLSLLQMRPLVLSREMEELSVDDIPPERLLCQSSQVLGHGAVRDLRDVVVVDANAFERSRSAEAAAEVARINERLVGERRGYLLVGPGRWGSLDPLLGIPVKWDQICGARAIVEAEFRDMSVDPSQGSHFFHNLTAFQIGYFTVNPRVRDSFVDWEWLASSHAVTNGPLVRHIRLERGLTVKINGRARRGVVLKGE